MKFFFVAAALAVCALPATAQAYAANNGYRVCAPEQAAQGLSVVKETCGELQSPDFANVAFGSEAEVEAARIKREGFTTQVSTYNRCVTQFINSYRRPGAPADSTAPDQAACAHSWAEDQATQAVRDYGKACVDFSNRSMTDSKIAPWSGECYPSIGNDRG